MVKNFGESVGRSAGEGAGSSCRTIALLTASDAALPCVATSIFSTNNGHFCAPAPINHDFMRRTKIPAHGIVGTHISETKTITD
jgi:hypothetical protein